MAEMIDKRVVLEVLEVIREEIWGVDIPSATVPEYVEHHRQMQALMKLVDKEKEHIKSLPSEKDKLPDIDVGDIKPCEVCDYLEDGDTLYKSSDWDGGIGFDYIRDIRYCPKCGRRL